MAGVTEDYLREYHDARPGVTERLLERCAWHGRSPYDDVADAVLAEVGPLALVLDLACGSGPLASRLPQARWLGFDRSCGELDLAGRRGAVALADAHHLPLSGNSVDAVASTCALMLLRPLGSVLREVSRVLRPGGVLVATAPWPGPFEAGDVFPLARLVVPIGTLMANPQDRILRRWEPGTALTGGLVVESVSDRRWTVPLRTSADVDGLLESLYLPGVSPRRIALARRALVRWSGSRRRFPVPIRTWVARLPA